MRHIRLIGLSGIVLAGLAGLSIGTRPTLQAQQPTTVMSTAYVGGAFGGPSGEDNGTPPPVVLPRPLNVAETKIRLKLQDKVPMNFANEVPLEEVLKHVKQGTIDKVDFPDGLPIYVDPVGLQEAERSITSPVAIDLKGIPLATSLKLVLDQLSLTYWVHPDGLIIVTSKENEDIPADTDTQIVSKLAAIQREVLTLRDEIRLLRGLPSRAGMASGPMGGGMGSMGGAR